MVESSSTGAAAVAGLPAEHALSRLFPADDGTLIHYFEWPPTHGATRAVLLYLHGIASHAGWFVETAEVLSGDGIHVVAVDRRGSGRSGGPRGHLARFEQALADLQRTIELVQREHPHVPLVLAASSWAAKLGPLYAVSRPADLAGLVLLGPGLTPRVNLSLGRRLRVLFTHATRPTTEIPIPLTPGLYTRTKPYLDYIRADPLRLLNATARFFWETNRLDRRRARVAGALRTPLLVLMGEQDAMMDVEATRRWFASAGSPDKTFELIPDGGHTLDFDADPQPYRSRLAEWVVAQDGTRRGAALRVERVEAWEVLLPFRFSFGHALAARASSQNLIVAVHLAGGDVGWGEGVPRDYVTGETSDSALARVRDEYAPAVVGRELDGSDVAGGLLALRHDLHQGGRPPGASWCAVESALLDAVGRATGRPSADFLGGVARPVVRYSGVVPFGNAKVLAAILAFFRVYGFREIKLKVGRDADADVAAVRLARRIMGPDCDLRVDANCAWNADETLWMADRLRPFGVGTYEQPVPADDLTGLRRLVAELPEDVVVDESLCSLDDARRLVAERACTGFNVRVSKCGGPLGALEVVDVARQAGLHCQLGAQVGESGILTAAGRLVATAAAFPPFRYLEGSDNLFLLKRDLTHEALTVRPGGRGAALGGPGLGVRVRRDRLEEMALRRIVVGDERPAPQARAEG
jgi:muconate cycloisomerase